MPIQPVESRRLYLQIADQVRSLIAAGEFTPGSRLPAERELSKRFGVSRPSLREALIALEVQGYVDVRPGSGIIVTKPDSATLDRWKSFGPEASLKGRSRQKSPGTSSRRTLPHSNSFSLSWKVRPQTSGPA
jgi:GntR family transcriptional repressor for pyruvate dehydrogenase complex